MPSSTVWLRSRSSCFSISESQRLLGPPQRVDMALRRSQAHAHCADAQMCRAERPPALDEIAPAGFGHLAQAQAWLKTKRRCIPPSFTQIAIELLDRRAHLVVGRLA